MSKTSEAVKARNRAWKAKNKEHCLEYSRNWRKENAAKHREYSRQYYHDNIDHARLVNTLGRIKHRAAQGGIPFNLTIEDIIPPEYCPVLGIKLIPGSNSEASPSVDKVIPELGYVKGNTVVISQRANRIKSDASREEIEAILNYIIRHSSP